MRSKAKNLNTVQLLLLTIGTLVPCAAAITCSVLQLEQPGGIEIKKISLLFSVLSLPIYLIVFLLRESVHARKARKQITAMVTELTEKLSANEAPVTGQDPAQTQEIKSDRVQSADALVQKIVRMINA